MLGHEVSGKESDHLATVVQDGVDLEVQAGQPRRLLDVQAELVVIHPAQG